MKRGTIVLTQFPFTDLTSAKRRPALVLSPVESLEGDVVVAFITSSLSRFEPSTDLLFDENNDGFENAGLKTPSLIKLAKLATLNTSLFTGELGFLDKATMKDVDEKLKSALGLKRFEL